MFSLLARHRAQPVLAALSFTARSLSDAAFLARSVYVTMPGRFRPQHSDVKTELSAYGTVTRLYQLTPGPFRLGEFVATFEDEEVAKKLLEAKRVRVGGARMKIYPVKTVPPPRPVIERPTDDVKSKKVALRRLPVQLGCTTNDIAAVVKPFGSASIEHRAFRVALRTWVICSNVTL